jgi:CRP-like cAMP-binding protein
MNALLTPQDLAEWRQILNDLYHDRKLWSFRRKGTIPMTPEDIWIVYRGVVQLRTFYANGEETILGLAYSSMPFGLPLSQLEAYEAIALSDVMLLRLHHQELEHCPKLAQGMLREMNRRLQQSEALLAVVGVHPVKDRLRALVLLLHQELGQVTPNGVRLSVKLTHQQLADMIGTTRVTVTRLLSELKREGLQLSFSGNNQNPSTANHCD